MDRSSPDVTRAAARQSAFREEIEIRGHIIDSLILPKILDVITSRGGRFVIKDLSVGHHPEDASYALVEVQAADEATLAEIVHHASDHGAVSTALNDCRLEPCVIDGVFPEGFYSTTNQATEIRLQRRWHRVIRQEMDCAVAVEPDRPIATCVPMAEVRKGQWIVVGHGGVRVIPEARSPKRSAFEFMGSNVSTEKPKGAAIREIAAALLRARAAGRRILFVGGPAIIHTGSGEHLCALIRRGYVDVLFAGNALAAHDIEQSMFGTSLGIRVDHGRAADAGHEHHLRAINRIRRAGSIAQAVAEDTLTSGVMYECVRRGVEFLLAGSIRDDGPLPDVVTDALEAQRRMRSMLTDVGFCLMVATTLHSIAVGNLLPAAVDVACIDINPSTVIKLADRGSLQTVGLVTDVEPFLRELLTELTAAEEQAAAGPLPEVAMP